MYGAATAALIVQATKGIPGIVKLPTRLWAYIISVVIMVLATAFTASLITPQVILLCFANAVVVHLQPRRV